MPSNTVLASGPAVGAAGILIWSCSCVFFPPVSTAVRTSVFRLAGALSGLSYIPRTQSSWPVDHVDLSCCFYSWWEGLGSSLVTLPLGFHCGFISTSACGSSMWFAPEAALEDLGLPHEGQGWGCCSCLGHRGSGSTRYSGELAARAAGSTML